jgi:hypothetical protein
VADAAVAKTASTERLERLTEAYREILSRYAEIERLSREEKRLLSERGSIASVNEILLNKREVLAEIHAAEDRVASARSWWKRARNTLPVAEGRELLAILDTISCTVERTLALEVECRHLLARTLAWGSPAAATGAGAAPIARSAYARCCDPSSCGGTS